jgi:RNA polymerase sigma-70 factor (ECF subfamily)
MTEKDDNELVYEALNGSRSSFETLIERHQNRIFHMILQMTNDRDLAKDITQDVFLKVWTNLKSFDFRHRFFSWIYRIALNSTLTEIKSGRRFSGLSEAAGVASDSVDDAGEIRSRLLRKAIRELKDKERSVILLKYYFGLSYAEIADTEGISEARVKDRLFNARLSLRKKLVEFRYFDND